MKEKQILGWREWVGFPDIGIDQIKAKVDSGARTSCLHAFRVELFQREGRDWISFDIHPLQRNNEKVISCEAPLLDKRTVRDSGGHEEIRYVIETTIRIGDQTHTAEVTLTDRDTMKFRVLLGRTLFRGKYLVDANRSYVCGKKKRKQESAEETS